MSFHSPNNYYNSFEAKQFIAKNMIQQSRVLLSESHLTRSTSSHSFSRLHRSFTAITPLKSQPYDNPKGDSFFNNYSEKTKTKNEQRKNELEKKRQLEIDLQLHHSNQPVSIQGVSSIYQKQAAVPIFTHDQAFIVSLEKENRLLKSELKEHQQEMTGFEMKVQHIQDDNRKLRHALQKTAKAEQHNQVAIPSPLNLQVQSNEQLLKQSSMNYELLEKIRSLQEELLISEADREDNQKKSVQLAKKVKIIIAKKKEEKEQSQTEIDELKITINQLEQENESNQKAATNWRDKYQQISIQCEGLLNQQQSWLQREQEVQDVIDLDKLQLNTLINQHTMKIQLLQDEIIKERNQSEEQMKVFNNALKSANLQFQEASETGKQAQMTIAKLEEEKLLIVGENNRLKRIDEELKKSRLREEQYIEDIKKLKDQLDTIEQGQSMERMIKKLNQNNLNLHQNMLQKATQTNRQIYGEMETQTDSYHERQNMHNEDLKEEIVRLNNQINELMVQIARYKNNNNNINNNITSDPAENTLSFPFLTDSISACPNLKQLEPLISSTQSKKLQIQMENHQLKQRLNQLESQFPSQKYITGSSKLNNNNNNNHSSIQSNIGSHGIVSKYDSLQIHNQSVNGQLIQQNQQIQQQSINTYLIPPHALTHRPPTALNNQPYLYS